MLKTISITQARYHLTALVRDLHNSPIQLTRHGKPVAVLLSISEYNRLRAARPNLWDAYSAFRERNNLQELEIGPETWENIRDSSPGREID
jgi:antitoxin Phd